MLTFKPTAALFYLVLFSYRELSDTYSCSSGACSCIPVGFIFCSRIVYQVRLLSSPISIILWKQFSLCTWNPNQSNFNCECRKKIVCIFICVLKYLIKNFCIFWYFQGSNLLIYYIFTEKYTRADTSNSILF